MPDDHIHPVQPHTPPAPRRAESDNHAAGRAQPQPAAAPRTLLATVKDALWSKAPAPAGRPHDSFREIVETVVFVVVLVLLLKSFIAEAFVIPTGSMADTLWGYQKVVVCPSCGHQFPLNCSHEVDPQDGGAPVPVVYCMCENCRQIIHLLNPRWDEQPVNLDYIKEIPDPGSNSGDRVLVMKFPYDLFPGKPNRWDVVVFKYPGHSGTSEPFRRFPNSGPQQNWVQMNYIKRLIGLGNETIGIYYGNLYRMAADPPPPPPANVPQRELWMKDYMNENASRELLEAGDRRFEILRKPPAQILAMKRLVYDNDKPAKDLADKPPRWVGEEGAWVSSDPHGFRYAPQGEALGWLRYRHILRSRGDRPELITDFLGYNTYYPRKDGVFRDRNAPPPRAEPPPADWKPLQTNWVGDLILECEVTVEDPKGELVLELSRGVDRFRALWDLASGKCTLYRTKYAWEEKKPPEEKDFKDLADAMTTLKGKGTYRVRFANVDERLTVWVNDKLAFGDGVTYEPPQKRGPYANDLQPTSIGVRGGTLSVHHLKVWRDTYYTTNPGSADGSPSEGNWNDPDKWGPLRELHGKTLYVQPGHYLCLGDNSTESSDSRDWGAVPERLMLGRALMVYYPFYFPYWPLKSPVNRVGAIE
jgi:signal peptidase I